MSETIMFPTNYELVVKDKATAMQYAISQARVYSENSRCYILNLELAKSIFKLFIDNMSLPDVHEDSSNNSEMSQETADELDKALGKFQKSVIEIAKAQVAEEKIKECLGNLNESITSNVNENSAKTYDDVARELFHKRQTFFFDRDEYIVTSLYGVEAYGYATNCTSEKQAEKLLALNRLMNVAKYLNERNPEIDDFAELYKLKIKDDKIVAVCHQCEEYGIVFNNYSNAQDAVDILGDDTIRLALSTDW